jgi:hypothetical protein
VNEVAHFVIDPEMHDSGFNVPAEKRTRAQKIEYDASTRDFRVMIASGVVLPKVPVPVLARDLA